MKNIQKTILKILFLIIILCAGMDLTAQSHDSVVAKADSLFASKQYTQSLELYQEILSQNSYSESMLLKMAFIQEGLGHLSESLYYLNLYYLASKDKPALSKMEELATKHHLSGYKSNQTRQIHSLLREKYDLIIKILGGALTFLFALLIYQKKRKINPLPVAISMVMLLAVLFYHVNFSQKTNTGIVHNNSTYLMGGPSAGSSVVSIIDEGHLLDILDRKDVWIHVKWMNKDAYIKEDQLLLIEL